MRESKHHVSHTAVSAKTIPFTAATRHAAGHHIEPEDFAGLWEWVVVDEQLNARKPAPRDCMWDWIVDDATLSATSRKN